jgi:hypothetical protein
LHRFYERFGFSEGGRADLPTPHLVAPAATRSARYRAGIVKVAEKASQDELRELLAEENLTVEELIGWGAKLS